MTPVPLPTAETVNLVPPDAAETQAMADGIASIVAGSEGLLPVQRALLEALFPAMTGFHVRLGDDAPAVTPAEFAARVWRGASCRSARASCRSCCCARWCATPFPTTWPRTSPRARASSASRRAWSTWRGSSRHGSLGLAAQDFIRNGYEGSWNEEAVARRPCTRPACSTGAWEFSVNDPELAAQWAALEWLPHEAIGRKVWEMYQARGFTFPGTPGSAPPLLAQHDWVHVLADYGTTVESEVEVFGFIARANDDMHAFSLLAMVISLFETGYLATGAGLFQASPGPLLVQPGTWRCGWPTPCGAARCATTTSRAPTASTS